MSRSRHFSSTPVSLPSRRIYFRPSYFKYSFPSARRGRPTTPRVYPCVTLVCTCALVSEIDIQARPPSPRQPCEQLLSLPPFLSLGGLSLPSHPPRLASPSLPLTIYRALGLSLSCGTVHIRTHTRTVVSAGTLGLFRFRLSYVIVAGVWLPGSFLLIVVVVVVVAFFLATPRPHPCECTRTRGN